MSLVVQKSLIIYLIYEWKLLWLQSMLIYWKCEKCPNFRTRSNRIQLLSLIASYFTLALLLLPTSSNTLSRKFLVSLKIWISGFRCVYLGLDLKLAGQLSSRNRFGQWALTGLAFNFTIVYIFPCFEICYSRITLANSLPPFKQTGAALEWLEVVSRVVINMATE